MVLRCSFRRCFLDFSTSTSISGFIVGDPGGEALDITGEAAFALGDALGDFSTGLAATGWAARCFRRSFLDGFGAFGAFSVFTGAIFTSGLGAASALAVAFWMLLFTFHGWDFVFGPPNFFIALPPFTWRFTMLSDGLATESWATGLKWLPLAQ